MHQGIEQRLDQIQHDIEKIAEHQDIPLEDEQGPPKKANKPLIAAAFGFAGLKLGSFTLGKFGLSVDLINAYRRNKMEGLQDTVYAFFNAADKEKGVGKHLPFAFAAAITGASAGAIGGALLGWQRGERLHNAGELFTHPIDSMKKIFAKNPPKAHVKKTEIALSTTVSAPEEPTAIASSPTHSTVSGLVQAAQLDGTLTSSPAQELMV